MDGGSLCQQRYGKEDGKDQEATCREKCARVGHAHQSGSFRVGHDSIAATTACASALLAVPSMAPFT